jgi:hypothetical protein
MSSGSNFKNINAEIVAENTAQTVESGITRRPKVFSGTAVKSQSTESIIDDAKSIIRDQVMRLKIKSGQGFSLESEDAKNLRTYVQSLVEMSKEERELDKSDALKDMLKGLSNEELLELYKKQISAPK